ncbi:sodium-dependent transporter [Faecalibacillus faecis]|uniref:sodium-dependent transporter n=1 Tax=Faecalibacillus faecis TaxID=1982628 RepID=UPI00066487E0|nr:sodium-dependent transporter [Faecalibacillus faecis]RHB04420.1 sodium-dependent transporter [Coprobacillus sp. AM42-12AC]RHP24508.1 sodium-dependent transporter [Coprobacillus sp. AF34-1BH]
METNKKSSFSGRLGYVMAVAGSAVGLGNIWRFPYLAAKYGGGIFLLTYIILALTVGFALLVSETALGRKTGNNPIKAYKMLGAKKLKIGGWLNSIIPMLIVPYYCVIGGWVCKYLFEYLRGSSHLLTQDTYFSSFISSSLSPAFWLIVFAVLTFIVVIKGVEKGIEKVSKVLMPILVIIAIFISVYGLMTPGAIEGLKYYIVPDFSNFSIMTVIAAVGQMFYSLSIGMGILFTYGSYMKKEVDLEKAISQVEIMDTLIAFLAGLMIIPAVFAFSGKESLNAGASLMFITMPKVFDSLQLGGFIGLVFFLLVLFAALTSAISLMECSVATLMEQLHISRKKASFVMIGEMLLLGIPISLGYGVLGWIQPLGMTLLDFFDFMTNSCMMPVAALSTVLLIIFVTKISTVSDEVKISSAFKREKIYNFVMKYICVPTLIVILLSYILSTFGIITL